MYLQLTHPETQLTYRLENSLDNKNDMITTTSTVGMTLFTPTISDSSTFTTTDCGLTIFMFSSLFLITGHLLDRKLNRDRNLDQYRDQNHNQD